VKRLIVLIALALCCVGFQIFVNCSQPLESSDLPNPVPPFIRVDTLYIIDTVVVIDSGTVVDTVIVSDTVTVVDTNWVYDTTYVSDTVMQIDTVFVVDTLMEVDTMFAVDTVYQIDTVFVVDSTSQTDTVFIIDTVLQIDTVVVIEPGDSGPIAMCARLSSCRQEIVWMFRNPEGDYRLEFTAASERDNPDQTLVVAIDGEKYFWKPSRDSEFITEQHLEQNAIIRINSKKPPAFGHAIDVCLTVSKL
jgi:hypothetical protein